MLWSCTGGKNPDGTWADDTSFMASMEKFFQGVLIPQVHETELQYGALLLAIGDGKALAELLETKKSVGKATQRICRMCNVTSARRSEVHSLLCPTCPFLLTTTASYERDQLLVQTHIGAPEEMYSKLLGQSGRPNAFARSLSFLSVDYIAGLPGSFAFYI